MLHLIQIMTLMTRMGLSSEQIKTEFEDIIYSKSTLEDLIESLGLEPMTELQSERTHRAILRYESALKFVEVQREEAV